ncbi:MAG: hypothetical protein J3R72DRAFT_452920 [Linnemannia gamsii]|nr:MAG: hypothetical protein J3R72DRAFT_452920 [Linnemannia gamsii]
MELPFLFFLLSLSATFFVLGRQKNLEDIVFFIRSWEWSFNDGRESLVGSMVSDLKREMVYHFFAGLLFGRRSFHSYPERLRSSVPSS